MPPISSESDRSLTRTVVAFEADEAVTLEAGEAVVVIVGVNEVVIVIVEVNETVIVIVEVDEAVGVVVVFVYLVQRSIV